MATSKTAKTMYESGQAYNAPTAAVDSGDHKTFTVTGKTIFSGYSGKEVVVAPNGIVTGRDMLSTHATNNTVTISGFTAYSKGVLRTVDATTLVVSRPATAVAKINSITMTDAGAIAEVEGTDGASAIFSETRGAAGGPPVIPADSVEIGQVRLVTSADGVIAASEIQQVVGTHAERFDLPSFSTNNVGEGNSATVVARKNAFVSFDDTLPLIHTDTKCKGVYVTCYTPIFAEVGRSMDFVPAENTHSLSSTQYYNGTVGSVSSSLGQCSFTALMDDNITDSLVGIKDKIVTIKFYPDRNRAPYTLTQGILGMKRTFPVANQNQASITLSAENPSADFSS